MLIALISSRVIHSLSQPPSRGSPDLSAFELQGEPRDSPATAVQREVHDDRSDALWARRRVISSELGAARGAWRATNALVWLAVLQTLLAALSIGALLVSLALTRRAVASAADSAKATAESVEIARRAARPFVQVELDTRFAGDVEKGVSTGDRELGPLERDMIVRPVLRNHGGSPAVDVSCSTAVVEFDPGYSSVDDTIPPSLGPVSIPSGGEVYMRELRRAPMGDYYEFNDRHYLFSASLTYSDVAGEKLANGQEFCFDIWPQNPGEGSIYDIAVERISREEFDRLAKENREAKNETKQRRDRDQGSS